MQEKVRDLTEASILEQGLTLFEAGKSRGFDLFFDPPKRTWKVERRDSGSSCGGACGEG